ncbi:hypothetical protein FHG87_017195 [Trinorchestia longiramus]|nr:hypothetical protein FHG87_017195 [Trinorchestia longiramus]
MMGMPKKDPNTKLKETVERRQQEFVDRFQAFDKARKERTGDKVISEILGKIAQVTPNPSKLSAAEFPGTVLAQIRQCVQLLAHDDDRYKMTSVCVLAEVMMRFPVLVDCVVNNILSVYNKPRKLYQRQAKLLGIGCVFRYGLRHVSVRVLQRLIAEIVLVRYSSNKDDVEIFFLITALQEDSKVAVVSHLIVEGMSGDLARPISGLKPTTLWLRVVLAERMMSQGLDLPVWLHDTFLPKQVDAFGGILLPKSQKLAANHPVFSNFIDLLANYHKLRTARQLGLGLQPIPNPVLVFFKNRIAPTIINCYRLAGKKITFELAYRLLMSVLSCRLLDLDTLERVVQWSVAGEGLNFFLTMDKRPLKQALCRLILSFDNLQGPYDRSRLALCVLQGSLVVPKLRHVAQQRLQELNQEHAHNCVNNAVNQHWAQRLSEREAGLMLKLVTLPQCRGLDNKMWRQQVAEGLARRALRWEDSWKRRHIYEEQMQELAETSKQQQTEKSEEKLQDSEEQGEAQNGEVTPQEDQEDKTQENGEGSSELKDAEDTETKLPWEQPLQQFTEKPIMSKGNRRAFYSKDLDSTKLFFRFLVHAAQDHETIFHLIIRSFNTAIEELKKDAEFLRLDTERYDCFKKLSTYQQLLYRGTPQSSRLRLLLQVILSQLGLELLLKCARDTEDIIQDFIPCVQQYLDEEGQLDAVEQEERGDQLMQEYEQKLKELEREKQRNRRRRKREMMRQMQAQEGDANLIPLPGQDPSEMPDFSKPTNARDEEDECNKSNSSDDESVQRTKNNGSDWSNDEGTRTDYQTCGGNGVNETENSGDESIPETMKDGDDSCDERQNFDHDEKNSAVDDGEEENDGVLPPASGENKWLSVLVDLLLALCTRPESWWRVTLKPTAFLLAGRMNSELLACVTEALFNEDLVESAKKKKKKGEDDDDDQEEDEEGSEQNGSEESELSEEGEEDGQNSTINDSVTDEKLQDKAKSDASFEEDDEESDSDDSATEDQELMDVDEAENMDTDDGLSVSEAKKKKKKSTEKVSKLKKAVNPDALMNSDDDAYSDDNDDSDDSEDDEGRSDDSDADEDKEEEEEEEEELETRMKQSKLEEMKGALFKVLGPSGPDDAVEEDMDKVPPEELRALNIQLGAVLGSYIKKKKVNPNALSGRIADVVQFRNRALDIVEGLIDGPLPCELLLKELLLPLLQTMALHMEERMTDLNNRIRKAVQHIREKKKYINVGDMSIEKFQECLVELFDVAKAVPETKHGFVTLIRCSVRFCEQRGITDNPIIPAYVSLARNFLRNSEVDGLIVLEPLFLEVPELQSALCRGLVEEIFSPVPEETDAEDDFKAKCRKIFEKKKEYPNNYPVLDGKMTTVWLLLEGLFSHILPKTAKLSEDECWAVAEVTRHIEHYTGACDQPKLKDVAVINFVLKVILRYPCGKACVDWDHLCKALFEYRARMSRQATSSKGVKMELKKLLDTSLRSQCPYAVAILKDRKVKKNQKQALRKEKRLAEKRKLEDPSTVAGSKALLRAEAHKEAKKSLTEGTRESIDDLFETNSKYIDEEDPELDLDERIPKKRRIEEEAEADILKKAKEIRAAKTAHNRKKRQRSKLSKKSKQAALMKLKEMEKERKMKNEVELAVQPESNQSTSVPKQSHKDEETLEDKKSSKAKKSILKANKKPKDSKQGAVIKEKKLPQRLLIKANRKRADAALDKDLRPGLFKYCKGGLPDQ